MRAIYVANDPSAHLRLARRKAGDVMSRPPVTVSGDALLEEALTRMIRTGLRHLVVVDDDGRCLGMLSDRSIAAAWAGNYSALSQCTVRTALEPEPALVKVTEAVVDAARRMRSFGVDAVAVIDADSKPVGVITGSDFIALLAR